MVEGGNHGKCVWHQCLWDNDRRPPRAPRRPCAEAARLPAGCAGCPSRATGDGQGASLASLARCGGAAAFCFRMHITDGECDQETSHKLPRFLARSTRRPTSRPSAALADTRHAPTFCAHARVAPGTRTRNTHKRVCGVCPFCVPRQIIVSCTGAGETEGQTEGQC